jgi:hypothetical protein
VEWIWQVPSVYHEIRQKESPQIDVYLFTWQWNREWLSVAIGRHMPWKTVGFSKRQEQKARKIASIYSNNPWLQ